MSSLDLFLLDDSDTKHMTEDKVSMEMISCNRNLEHL